MNHLRKTLAFAGSVAIVAMTLTLSNPMNTMHAQSSVDPNLEGTWSVVVTPDGGTPFRALATFGSGGTVIESSSGGASDKGGQGVWKRTGGRTFGLTVEQFQYDPAGNWV